MRKFYTLIGGALTAASMLMGTGASAQLYTFSTHTFTPAGATGKNGPTLVDCQTAYTAEPWSSDLSFFNMTTQGIQEWTVPATGNYLIEAFGAQGGDDIYTAGPSTGGLGARMTGEFALTEGQILYIVVGQEGEDTQFAGIDNAGAGGGGGSFVWDPTDLTNPLIAAGGGGGGCSNFSVHAGSDANDTEDGNPSEFISNAGTGGNGGLGNVGGGSYWAGAGCGWLTDGTGGNQSTLYNYNPGSSGAEGGRSPLNGGIGGTRWNDGTDEGGDGGFGGGGGGGSDNMGSGGGGGYSGGGGDRGGTYGDGGGGGSYNAGTAQDNTAGFNSGDGYVIITQLCTPLTTTISADTICYGDSLTLTSTSTIGGTVTWDLGAPNGSAFMPDTTGLVTYTATSDTTDCPAQAMIFIQEAPQFTLGSSDEILGGDGTAFITITGGSFPFTFDWDIDGTGDFDDNQNQTGLSGGTYTVTVMSSNGCTATQSVDVTSQLGIGEFAGTFGRVYPNPSNGQVTFEFPGNFSYTIVSSIGQTVLSGESTDAILLDIEELTSGTYFVNVVGENYNEIVKLSKH